MWKYIHNVPNPTWSLCKYIIMCQNRADISPVLAYLGIFTVNPSYHLDHLGRISPLYLTHKLFIQNYEQIPGGSMAGSPIIYSLRHSIDCNSQLSENWTRRSRLTVLPHQCFWTHWPWGYVAVILEVYHQTCNISHTLVGNIIVDNSDVVGASPVGAAPTTFELST